LIALRHEFGSGRCRSGLNDSVNLRDFAGGSLDVEEVASHFVACGGEPLGFCAVLQRGQHGGGDGLGIARRDEAAGDSLLNQIGEATYVCGDDRDLAE